MDRRFLPTVLPAVLCLALAARPASAGFLFGKKAKKTPAELVPELIQTLKTDGDERKRSAAAEELRQYDPAQFPDMIPALVDALLTDKKSAVRSEAAQTLGKLRPVTSSAGAALEQALTKDSSMRVRLQARSSLLQYRWAGYSPKVREEPPPQSKEPPLAPEPPVAVAAPAPAPVQAAPPRLAPVPAPAAAQPQAPRPAAQGPRPLPQGPPVPASPVSLDRSAKPAEDKGPELTPP